MVGLVKEHLLAATILSHNPSSLTGWSKVKVFCSSQATQVSLTKQVQPGKALVTLELKISKLYSPLLVVGAISSQIYPLESRDLMGLASIHSVTHLTWCSFSAESSQSNVLADINIGVAAQYKLILAKYELVVELNSK